MKTENKTEIPEVYVVVPIIRFNLLCGYKIKDTRSGKYLPYDFDEVSKWQADAKCDLQNALAYGCKVIARGGSPQENKMHAPKRKQPNVKGRTNSPADVATSNTHKQPKKGRPKGVNTFVKCFSISKEFTGLQIDSNLINTLLDKHFNHD